MTESPDPRPDQEHFGEASLGDAQSENPPADPEMLENDDQDAEPPRKDEAAEHDVQPDQPEGA